MFRNSLNTKNFLIKFEQESNHIKNLLKKDINGIITIFITNYKFNWEAWNVIENLRDIKNSRTLI
jgi:hypothetical protein